ncbi:MAG: 7-cyano-7-deazaguanine synthase, partial [Fusobacteria bacterium]|nr:7-cyano-7-deazaguanine synthase [Fusobacteriota bacterium]
MGKKALVLLSGGLDSGTALYYAKSIGFNEIYAISFLYGQKHTKELNMAKKLADNFGIKEHKIVNLDMSLWGGSSLTDNSLDIPDYED